MENLMTEAGLMKVNKKASKYRETIHLFSDRILRGCTCFELGLKNKYRLKNAVFWDVAPCRYCVNRRFG
jgi:hypothetical protein